MRDLQATFVPKVDVLRYGLRDNAESVAIQLVEQVGTEEHEENVDGVRLNRADDLHEPHRRRDVSERSGFRTDRPGGNRLRGAAAAEVGGKSRLCRSWPKKLHDWSVRQRANGARVLRSLTHTLPHAAKPGDNKLPDRRRSVGGLNGCHALLFVFSPFVLWAAPPRALNSMMTMFEPAIAAMLAMQLFVAWPSLARLVQSR